MNTPKSFFSHFFLDLQDFLNKNLPDIKWIDIDNGQLDSGIRPPLTYPAVLIDFSAGDVNELGAGSYRMDVVVHLYLITDNFAVSYHKAPLNVDSQTKCKTIFLPHGVRGREKGKY